MSSAPKIGDFRSVPDNAPRRDAPNPPAVKELPKEEKSTGEDPPPVKKSPSEQYRDRLVEAQIDLDEARYIFDTVLEKNFYEETMKVGSHQVTFRTRAYRDRQRLHMALDALRPNLVVVENDMITKYNLAASLVKWKGVTYAHETEDDFDKAMAAIEALPDAVFTMLAIKIAEFDNKIFNVFSEGAAQTFC